MKYVSGFIWKLGINFAVCIKWIDEALMKESVTVGAQLLWGGRYGCNNGRYQIAAAQWRMVHFGTLMVGPIHTPNIRRIDEGLISISAMKSNPFSPVKRINAHDLSYDGTTSK